MKKRAWRVGQANISWIDATEHVRIRVITPDGKGVIDIEIPRAEWAWASVGNFPCACRFEYMEREVG